jgi:hypothetical protein
MESQAPKRCGGCILNSPLRAHELHPCTHAAGAQPAMHKSDKTVNTEGAAGAQRVRAPPLVFMLCCTVRTHVPTCVCMHACVKTRRVCRAQRVRAPPLVFMLCCTVRTHVPTCVCMHACVKTRRVCRAQRSEPAPASSGSTALVLLCHANHDKPENH